MSPVEKRPLGVLLALLLLVPAIGSCAKRSAISGQQRERAGSPVDPPAGSGGACGAPVIPIARLRGADRSAFMGRRVTVEGFYYDGSIPMIVDDFQRVLINIPLPVESYLPLVGPRPGELAGGDRIAATGLLGVPGPSDPTEVRDEIAVLRLETAGDIRILSRGGKDRKEDR